MQREVYDRLYSRSDTGPGWKAIDDALARLYGAQEPVHYVARTASAALGVGGGDYLNGISVYASSSGGVQHLHYVTYGFSSLFYDAEAFGKEASGFGFELTFVSPPRRQTRRSTRGSRRSCRTSPATSTSRATGSKSITS